LMRCLKQISWKLYSIRYDYIFLKPFVRIKFLMQYYFELLQVSVSDVMFKGSHLQVYIN
jgi:hypothetical protein